MIQNKLQCKLLLPREASYCCKDPGIRITKWKDKYFYRILLPSQSNGQPGFVSRLSFLSYKCIRYACLFLSFFLVDALHKAQKNNPMVQVCCMSKRHYYPQIIYRETAFTHELSKSS